MTSNSVAVIRYQYDNHLGSASLELDENAEIISYEEYHPFGTTSYRSGRTETETSQKRYKYVGKERDEETGLYYYGFRYYAAWLCRFVSVDPDANKYSALTPYCNAANNPSTFTDYKGRGPIFGKEKAKGENYFTGLGYGIVDGAFETIDAAKYVGYMGIYIGNKQNNFIASTLHFGQSLFDAEYRSFSESMDKIPDIVLGIAIQLIENEEFRKNVVNNLVTSLSSATGSIGTYFKELTFQEGNGLAGYQHGKILFEVLLEVATSGTSSLKHIVPLHKKGGKELTDYLIKQGVPELLESKFTKSFVDPTDGVFNKSIKSSVKSNIVKSVTKKGVTKTDHLFLNRSEAINWARKQLGHNTTKMYDDMGKLIGWKNKAGDTVYWGHGDWGKGVGSSTFPHLNYKIGNTKGHLFLQNKIQNRGMMDAFNSYFEL